MKEKLIEQFNNLGHGQIGLENGDFIDFETAKNFISQALDEYADIYKDQIKEARQCIIDWYKDNNLEIDFPEELHLADIIEMHLFRYGVNEYADWKIKECLPEKKSTFGSGGKVYDSEEVGWNACIDKILANKDKK